MVLANVSYHGVAGVRVPQKLAKPLQQRGGARVPHPPLRCNARRNLRWAAPRSPFTTRASAAAPDMEDNRIPVTVVTGFLGSGKTTLLNHILSSPDHQKRIAIIENEFGDIGIDKDLVVDRLDSEDMVVMLNGCICCTVREDLMKSIQSLVFTKGGEIDQIIIETTGVANPAPVVQTFYLDELMANFVKLDGVVAVVDSKHVERHLDAPNSHDGSENEAVTQVAFADRIIVNKTDLVDSADIARVESKIKQINDTAPLKRSTRSNVDMDFVLGIGGYDLDRIVENIQPDLLEEENHGHSHGHAHDHEEPVEGCPECESEHGHSHGEAHAHSHDSHDHGHNHDEPVEGCEKCEEGEHGHSHGHDHGHDHAHHSGVGSVSLYVEEALDLERVNDWLSEILATRSDDIYRMKGVLHIEGVEERFVFQGVHQIFEGTPERAWGAGETKASRLVFIGKGLVEEELMTDFRKCIA